MYCSNCRIHYEDPDKRFCEACGSPLVNAPPPPTRAPRTTGSTQPPESVYVQLGGRPRRVRRSYLLILLVLLLLCLVCGCLMYTDVLAAPVFLTDIFREYTNLGFGCLNGLILLFVFYLIIIILKLDYNCIYVPIGMLVILVLCVALNIIGVIELPDLADRIVDKVINPVRTLPLPWEPDQVIPKYPDQDQGEENRSGGCCPDYSFNNIYYQSGYLYFDVYCRLEPFKEQCADGKVYDGAGKFWTNVSCCIDPDYNDSVLRCEGLDYITAKVGDIRLELDYEGTDGRTCTIYSTFTPPPLPSLPDQSDDSYSDCPSGQSMCAGICCSNGHCCDWGSGFGCYDSCP